MLCDVDDANIFEIFFRSCEEAPAAIKFFARRAALYSRQSIYIYIYIYIIKKLILNKIRKIKYISTSEHNRQV